MASSRQVLLLAAVACLTSLASGIEWTVGDDDGWRPKFNETGWTDGMTFMVGDALVFNYLKGTHNVVQVREEGFATCNHDGNQLRAWSSGHDVVQLDSSGRWLFICTMQNHCLEGMKLAINVLADDIDDPLPLIPFPFPFPFPFPGTAPAAAPSPSFRFPFPFFGPSPSPALAPAPASPAAALPSAAVRNPVCVSVAVAAAAVVAAALAF